ncbi:MAG: hypothetical protein ACRERR_12065 [Moraxellaceae bacterium]
MNGMARMPATASFFTDAVGEPLAAVEARQPQDLVGMWYGARQRLGLDDRMWFGVYEAGRSTPQWHTRSHRFSDGIGGLALLLWEQYGHDCGPLPLGRDQHVPHWREIWRARKPLPEVSGKLQWRSLAPNLSDCSSHVPVSLLLSVMQTRGIEQRAREAGVNSSVWLLWTADAALRATLTEAGSVNDWIYPVNLRGAVSGADEFTNHCSGLQLKLTAEQDAQALKQQIALRFSRLEHWRQWMLLTLGRWIGQRGVNFLCRFVQGKPGRHTGSYSNLGEWSVPGLDGISCSAPGSPAYPVAVSTVLCNGRRTLACRLHPVIGGNPGRAIEFLKHWRKLSLHAEA